jgi:transcriptional regulator with XRE-family HTH domain
LQEDKLILLEGWSRDGLSLEQIAKNIGIDESTIYKWKSSKVEIFEALKKGKEVADYEVENAVFKRATGYTYEEKTYEDGVLKKTVIKEVPPDTTAQIYWLKHRQREKWGEKEVPNNNDVNERITNIANLLNNPQPNRSDEDVQ